MPALFKYMQFCRCCDVLHIRLCHFDPRWDGFGVCSTNQDRNRNGRKNRNEVAVQEVRVQSESDPWRSFSPAPQIILHSSTTEGYLQLCCCILPLCQKRLGRRLTRFLFHKFLLLYPVLDNRRNFIRVLIHDHRMGITFDPYGRQRNPSCVCALLR